MILSKSYIHSGLSKESFQIRFRMRQAVRTEFVSTPSSSSSTRVIVLCSVFMICKYSQVLSISLSSPSFKSTRRDNTCCRQGKCKSLSEDVARHGDEATSRNSYMCIGRDVSFLCCSQNCIPIVVVSETKLNCTLPQSVSRLERKHCRY